MIKRIAVSDDFVGLPNEKYNHDSYIMIRHTKRHLTYGTFYLVFVYVMKHIRASTFKVGCTKPYAFFIRMVTINAPNLISS